MSAAPSISIIVPVYNVEKYLARCIDSLLSQTHTDFELLLVDDGSTDGSGAICDRYAYQDDRIRVVHKGNGGLSAARNSGIEIARGRYFGFVDSDDYVDADMYEHLYGMIEKEGADLAVCGYYDCYCDLPPRKNDPYYAVMGPQEALNLVFDGKISGVSACNKLYRSEIFDDIRYPQGKTSEDAYVIVRILMKTRKVVVSSEQKYYYIHRRNSVTTSRFSRNQLDVIEAYQLNYKLVGEVFPESLQMAFGRLCWAHFVALDRMLLSHAEQENSHEAKELVRFIRAHLREILQCKFLTRNRRLSAVVLTCSFPLYRFLLKRYVSKYMILNE